ncbi:aminotransferase class IV [Jiella marina]|uniref:aminotransferase class IV n=1 Tax=Jiella sp. LLJ827 TaxID=2917712 RepID=UPI002100D27D|nr:aminotransferase class IV [Jiella sp. LLJ827]MCQ0987744.1 aminotransferase class IV [Jiella sp. LLJ827]
MSGDPSAIWIDGGFRPAAGAIAANDRGLLLGDGVFDTALVLNGRVFRQADHLSRLMASCAVLGIPVSEARLEAAMVALAERCGDGSIRLTVTRGPGPRGLSAPAEPEPTVFGSLAPLVRHLMFAPVKLATARIRRNETSPTSRHKTLAYLDAVLATGEAKAAGADDALFLNMAGRLASTALANLFVIDGDRLLTPPLDEGVLPGITRKWVIENASKAGLTVEETTLPTGAANGNAMIATNSLRLISPVDRWDDTAQPRDERIDILARELRLAIAQECAIDPSFFDAAP